MPKAAHDAAYYQRHSTAIRAKRRARYRRNRAQVLARQAGYHRTEPGRSIHRQAAKKYATSPRGMAAMSLYVARAVTHRSGLRIATEPGFKLESTLPIFERFKRLKQRRPDIPRCVDHIIPKGSTGGPHADWNLQLITTKQHARKSASDRRYARHYAKRVRLAKLQEQQDRRYFVRQFHLTLAY